jgi:hypothetical protein
MPKFSLLTLLAGLLFFSLSFGACSLTSAMKRNHLSRMTVMLGYPAHVEVSEVQLLLDTVNLVNAVTSRYSVMLQKPAFSLLTVQDFVSHNLNLAHRDLFCPYPTYLYSALGDYFESASCEVEILHRSAAFIDTFRPLMSRFQNIRRLTGDDFNPMLRAINFIRSFGGIECARLNVAIPIDSPLTVDDVKRMSSDVMEPWCYLEVLGRMLDQETKEGVLNETIQFLVDYQK